MLRVLLMVVIGSVEGMVILAGRGRIDGVRRLLGGRRLRMIIGRPRHDEDGDKPEARDAVVWCLVSVCVCSLVVWCMVSGVWCL